MPSQNDPLNRHLREIGRDHCREDILPRLWDCPCDGYPATERTLSRTKVPGLAEIRPRILFGGSGSYYCEGLLWMATYTPLSLAVCLVSSHTRYHYNSLWSSLKTANLERTLQDIVFTLKTTFARSTSTEALVYVWPSTLLR